MTTASPISLDTGCSKAASALPDDFREALLVIAQTFFDFAATNPPRHQLMNERVIPGYEPSPAAYQPAVHVIEQFQARLRHLGVDDPAAVDLACARQAAYAWLVRQRTMPDAETVGGVTEK